MFTLPTIWPRIPGQPETNNSTGLNQRLLRALVPLAVIWIIVLYWAGTRIATNVATNMVLDQMVRAAEHAADGIPFFVRTGESLILELAQSEHLWNVSPSMSETQLSKGIRIIPYFHQLIYLDAYGRPVASYPQTDIIQSDLTPDEMSAVEVALRGAPQHTVSFTSQHNRLMLLSFVAPVMDPQGEGPVGALLGRTDIDTNPLMLPATKSLKDLLAGSGTGFITDRNHRVIFQTDPARLQEIWEPSSTEALLPVSTDLGKAYKDRNEDGDQWLVYHLPVNGYPWNVVIVVPNSVVLAQANQIIVPLALLIIVTGLVGIVVILAISKRITQPIGALSVAAEDIIQGEFSQPVIVEGHDELGRLGNTFERMRKRLRAQVHELGLLLEVSQAVAGSLNLEDSLPTILQSALGATQAAGVRLLLKHPENPKESMKTHNFGDAAAEMAPLDQEILSLAETDEPILIENLARARAVLDVTKIRDNIKALIAMPLMHETNYLGVLWLGYDLPKTFTQSEINLLSTLAKLTVMAVSNARLLEASEGHLQVLNAAFGSTRDAVIITDNKSRLLLGNPAAEQIFEMNITTEAGRLLSDVITQPELLSAMRSMDSTAATREIEFQDGRTFSASASPILRSDGSVLGRVAVLRDVSHFKRLDQFKSDAVAAVGHDLKSPLTIIKGCAAMLPMVGQLNPRQQEYADQIEGEIDIMSHQIDDLLDLYRIESGGEVRGELCHIGELIESVAQKFQDAASSKEITIEVTLGEVLPRVYGDQSLLRQAIGHLVDNSLKYTNTSGKVQIKAEMRKADTLISVQDNGVGISRTDQSRIFEKFFRVSRLDLNTPSGSGLGLAFVKSIIERHGGLVWVESQLGEGSTFFLTIPSRESASDISV